MFTRAVFFALTTSLLVSSPLVAQTTDLDPWRQAATKQLQQLVKESGIPGASAAVVTPEGNEILVVVGSAADNAARSLKPSDRMMAGSIGKTYFAAMARKLLSEKKLKLDDRVSDYLQDIEGFQRLAHANEITVAQLMRHQSGLPRYVMALDLWRYLSEHPDKPFAPGEQLKYVWDLPAVHEPGQGWAYSDTNYILLGLILEKITGRSVYDYVQQEILAPHQLKNTVRCTQPKLEGLVCGRTVLFGRMGIPEYVVEDGKLVINPQFEWCGGGYMTTPRDLAWWARVVFTGHAFDGDDVARMVQDAAAAPMLGPRTSYGLGVMIRETGAGTMLGHDGVFPGYSATMGYFPDRQVAVAIQVNSDDLRSLRKPLYQWAVQLAKGPISNK